MKITSQLLAVAIQLTVAIIMSGIGLSLATPDPRVPSISGELTEYLGLSTDLQRGMLIFGGITVALLTVNTVMLWHIQVAQIIEQYMPAFLFVASIPAILYFGAGFAGGLLGGLPRQAIFINGGMLALIFLFIFRSRRP